MELLASGQRIGYLLKSRVTDVDEFVETRRAHRQRRLRRRSRRSSRSSWPPGGVEDPLEELTRASARCSPDGGGPLECWNRAPAVGDRGNGREARAQHPGEASTARDGRRPPPCARGRSGSSRRARRRRVETARDRPPRDARTSERKPTAGLAAIRSRKSSSACVEISTTRDGAGTRRRAAGEVEAALVAEAGCRRARRRVVLGLRSAWFVWWRCPRLAPPDVPGWRERARKRKLSSTIR